MRRQQPADVVGERDVADQQHDRPVRAAAAAPNAVETVPSMPLAPRLASTRGASVAGREERLDVAHRHRGGDDERGVAGGSRAPSSAATRGSLRPRGSERRRDRARRPRGRRAASRRASRGRGAGASRSPTVASVERGSAPTIVATAPAGSCQACSGSKATWIASAEAVQPLAQRLGGRQVADAQHEVGRVRRRPRGIAQQRVVVRDRRLAAAGAGQRLGEQRDRGALGERGQRRAELRVALRAPGDEHRARRAVRSADERVDRARAGLRAHPRARQPRAPAVAAAAAGLLLGQRLVEHERLAQREVQVHRARGGRRARSRTRGRRAGASSACARAWRAARRPRGTTWPRCRRA